MLINYFKWQQEKNPSFCYVYKVNDENRLTRCFWIDGVGSMNYEHFGDIIAFDATHNTNQYGLIFVPFVGLNYHWQSIFFGYVFIPNEKAKSFVWIFERWLEVIGHPPLGIVTDQDPGYVVQSKVFSLKFVIDIVFGMF